MSSNMTSLKNAKHFISISRGIFKKRVHLIRNDHKQTYVTNNNLVVDLLKNCSKKNPKIENIEQSMVFPTQEIYKPQNFNFPLKSNFNSGYKSKNARNMYKKEFKTNKVSESPKTPKNRTIQFIKKKPKKSNDRNNVDLSDLNRPHNVNVSENPKNDNYIFSNTAKKNNTLTNVLNKTDSPKCHKLKCNLSYHQNSEKINNNYFLFQFPKSSKLKTINKSEIGQSFKFKKCYGVNCMNKSSISPNFRNKLKTDKHINPLNVPKKRQIPTFKTCNRLNNNSKVKGKILKCWVPVQPKQQKVIIVKCSNINNIFKPTKNVQTKSSSKSYSVNNRKVMNNRYDVHKTFEKLLSSSNSNNRTNISKDQSKPYSNIYQLNHSKNNEHLLHQFPQILKKKKLKIITQDHVKQAFKLKKHMKLNFSNDKKNYNKHTDLSTLKNLSNNITKSNVPSTKMTNISMYKKNSTNCIKNIHHQNENNNNQFSEKLKKKTILTITQGKVKPAFMCKNNSPLNSTTISSNVNVRNSIKNESFTLSDSSNLYRVHKRLSSGSHLYGQKSSNYKTMPNFSMNEKKNLSKNDGRIVFLTKSKEPIVKIIDNKRNKQNKNDIFPIFISQHTNLTTELNERCTPSNISKFYRLPTKLTNITGSHLYDTSFKLNNKKLDNEFIEVVGYPTKKIILKETVEKYFKLKKNSYLNSNNTSQVINEPKNMKKENFILSNLPEYCDQPKNKSKPKSLDMTLASYTPNISVSQTPRIRGTGKMLLCGVPFMAKESVLKIITSKLSNTNNIPLMYKCQNVMIDNSNSATSDSSSLINKSTARTISQKEVQKFYKKKISELFDTLKRIQYANEKNVLNSKTLTKSNFLSLYKVPQKMFKTPETQIKNDLISISSIPNENQGGLKIGIEILNIDTSPRVSSTPKVKLINNKHEQKIDKTSQTINVIDIKPNSYTIKKETIQNPLDKFHKSIETIKELNKSDTMTTKPKKLKRHYTTKLERNVNDNFIRKKIKINDKVVFLKWRKKPISEKRVCGHKTNSINKENSALKEEKVLIDSPNKEIETKKQVNNEAILEKELSRMPNNNEIIQRKTLKNNISKPNKFIKKATLNRYIRQNYKLLMEMYTKRIGKIKFIKKPNSKRIKIVKIQNQVLQVLSSIRIVISKKKISNVITQIKQYFKNTQIKNKKSNSMALPSSNLKWISSNKMHHQTSIPHQATV